MRYRSITALAALGLVSTALAARAQEATPLTWRFKAGDEFYAREVTFIEAAVGKDKPQPFLGTRHEWLYRVKVAEVDAQGNALLECTYERYRFDAEQEGRRYAYTATPVAGSLTEHMAAEIAFPVVKQQAKKEGKKAILRVAPSGRIVAWVQRVEPEPAPAPAVAAEAEPFDPLNAAAAPKPPTDHWLLSLPRRASAPVGESWQEVDPERVKTAQGLGMEHTGRKYRVTESAPVEGEPVSRLEYEDLSRRGPKPTRSSGSAKFTIRSLEGTGWVLFGQKDGRPRRAESRTSTELEVRADGEKARMKLTQTDRVETFAKRPAD